MKGACGEQVEGEGFESKWLNRFPLGELDIDEIPTLVVVNGVPNSGLLLRVTIGPQIYFIESFLVLECFFRCFT